MRKHRISERDIDALLHGSVPQGDDELRILANTVDAIRDAYSDRAPRPSAELAARLDLGNEAAVSASAGGLLVRSTSTTPVPANAATGSKRGFTRMFITWVTGLGLAAKIALAASTAAAVGIGAGAAGVLPAPAQDAFEQVVGSDTGTDETLLEQPAPVPTEDAAPIDEPSTDTDDVPAEEEPPAEEPGTDEAATHGEAVREAAHDKTDDGRPHGSSVREVASQNGQKHRADKDDADEAPVEDGTDADTDTEVEVEAEVEVDAEVEIEVRGKGKVKAEKD